MKKVLRNRYAYLALAALLALVLLLALRSGPDRTGLSLSQFETDLSHHGTVASATVHDDSSQVTGKLADGSSYVVSYPSRSEDSLTTRLLASGADVTVVHSGTGIWALILETYGPIIVLGGLFVWAIFALQGGGSRVAQFGKSRARAAGKEQSKVTFADVAGADEAVAELQEIKEFLEAPGRFQALGARIPKGVLLFGPPGTGKTLLARAVAGEAGVPFFSISGSDFVEMFVGVGASRVRDLFNQAKTNAPSIVFMDEIDAVGRHRGAGLGGGHDEREQTLNQLLVEMDGFDVRGGVILIAATNRPDILDPALLRPGRFDRQVVVDRPDLAGRRRILAVHARDKPLADNADLDVLAKRTPGFTGADLANLLNEAAILTARRNLRQIGMRECEEAIDRVLAGPERKTLVMSDHDKLVTAYHEAGHAIVGHVLPHADPIHKVSIVARSRSLGLTYTLPEDRYNHSRSQLRDAMAMCLGGRTAEEIVFAEPTTGAENDIEKVTQIARAMVTEYGMSDALGPQKLDQRGGEVFLGRELGHPAGYSPEVAALIDREVRSLIDEAHDRARAVLSHHRATLDRMAQELVERETLDTMDLEAILGPLAPWPATPGRPAAGSVGRAGDGPGSARPGRPASGGAGGGGADERPTGDRAAYGNRSGDVAQPDAGEGRRRRRPLSAPGRPAPAARGAGGAGGPADPVTRRKGGAGSAGGSADPVTRGKGGAGSAGGSADPVTRGKGGAGGPAAPVTRGKGGAGGPADPVTDRERPAPNGPLPGQEPGGPPRRSRNRPKASES